MGKKDKSGKSFLALAWALCIASGKRWLDREVETGPVVYVAAEGVSGVWTRAKSEIERFARVTVLQRQTERAMFAV